MSIVALLELKPRAPATGAVVTRRFVWNARERATYFGQQWEPLLLTPPSFETDLGFDGKKFGQGATPQVGEVELTLAKDDPAHGLVWANAEGSLRTAPWSLTSLSDPADGAFTAALPLRVESASVGDGLLRLTLIDDGQALRKPVLARQFGTTGVALLDSADVVDLKGKPVPNGWGKLLGLPGLLVDRANNIWLFLDRAADSVQGFYDGGAAFTLGVARANLAALIANAPAEGTIDYCLNAGGLTLARPWTEPTYPLTADLTAGGTRATDIALSIVLGRTALTFTTGSVAAFNALQSAACGLYIDDSMDIASALDQLFPGLGAAWWVNSAGTITLGRIAHSAPMRSFGETDVVSISRSKIVMPTRRRAVGYGRNNRVHSEGEIATILLVDDIAGLGALAVQDDVDFASQVTGAAKPAPNATRNIVTYSASAPGSPLDGDLWVDTAGAFAVFKLRSGGVWQTGANALTAYNALSGTPVALADINTTESTKLAGIAAGATRNIVTYSASAPGSPLDGDLWVDTAGAFAVFKLRSGGVWQTGANALTAYNALSGTPVALADINTTESTKLAGIAAGATRNIVTYSASAPGSPLDGDLWVDTSGAFAVFKLRSGGVWQTGANALTAYNALSGTPVALADINTTESTKLAGIAAGATRNIVTYSASAPGSPLDGDLWVDTAGAFAVFKLRSGGVWQTGANALTAYNALSGTPVALADINTTESTKLAGIAAGATVNRITRSASAPASPVDGDIWVDTSVTPNVTRARVGGAWQASANLVTQGTDIGVANGATVGAPAGTLVAGVLAETVAAGASGSAPQVVGATIGTSSTIQKLLQNGVTVTAEANLGLSSTSGGGTFTLNFSIEFRTAGGSWGTVSGASDSDSDSTPSSASVYVSGSVTNSSGVPQLYEFRAIGTITAGKSGVVSQPDSYLKV